MEYARSTEYLKVQSGLRKEKIVLMEDQQGIDWEEMAMYGGSGVRSYPEVDLASEDRLELGFLFGGRQGPQRP